jgi:polyphosphate kinase 2 (PPK2 family)
VAHFPTGGEIVLFDRSWYNRAMVDPIFGFCTTKEYDLLMRGVVGFEKDLVRQGTTLIKLYFSVSKEEQARRFARRKNDPLRQWKLSEVDIQAQERWDEFTEMEYRMLRDTHTNKAPRTVVRSDDKHRARLNVMKVSLDAVPYKGRDTDLDFARSQDRHLGCQGDRTDESGPPAQRRIYCLGVVLEQLPSFVR